MVQPARIDAEIRFEDLKSLFVTLSTKCEEWKKKKKEKEWKKEESGGGEKETI